MAHVGRRGLAQRLVRLMATLVYRDIDVHVPAGAVPAGPVLAVANHFGGLSDGVLLIDSSPRMPRVVARDVIWRVPVIGRLASAIGMIPVHRAADGSKGSNDETFASAYRALGSGDLVLIFPEGVTQDVPHMAQVRTGAARIALGARAAGVPGISVLPIGIHYENKAGFRTRALVQVGEPIDLDAWVDSRPGGVDGGADDRAAVRALTALVDQRLRRVAPDFPDWATAHALHTAAEVLLTDVDPLPAAQMQYGDLELLASRLNRLAEPDRSALVAASAEYRDAVRASGTSDRAVATAKAAGTRSVRWLGELLLVVVLMPFAMLGLAAALVPILLVTGVSRLPIAPAVRATAVPGVALLAFGGEWALFSWQSLREGGWDLGFVAVLLFPFFVATLFLVLERVVLLWRRWGSRRQPRSTELPVLAALRATVAERGWRAL